MGLQIETTQANFTAERWENMLRQWGPLWVTADKHQAPGIQGVHAHILVGIHGPSDGNPTVDLIDPGSGREVQMPMSDFVARYEQLATRPFAGLQIRHWPSRAQQAAQQSLVWAHQAARRVQTLTLPPLSPTNGGRSISNDALRVGDIILSTTNQVGSLGIRAVTNSVVSHAVLFVGNPDEVVEALEAGVIRQPISGALRDDSLAVAFRVPGLTDGDAQLVANYAAAQVGKKYDVWSAFTAAVPDWGPGWALRRVDIGTPNSTFFCSELVTEAFRQMGHPISVNPSDEVLPGDIPA